jgi:hypothetical protein
MKCQPSAIRPVDFWEQPEECYYRMAMTRHVLVRPANRSGSEEGAACAPSKRPKTQSRCSADGVV